MESSLLSISKIFTERLFRIPDYQRGYAWTEKQLKDYWNDLVQLEDGKNHYVGVLTLEDVPVNKHNSWEDDKWIIDARSYSPYYIVDGQQRMTTSIILIQAITEYITKGEKLNFTTIEDIKRKFIFDSKDEGISRSYIFGYEKDNPSYEFLKTKIFLEDSTQSETEQETIYTHNLENAKKYFSSCLNDLKFDEVEKVYKKLTQNFLFNIYTISNDIDVFIAFETMNNRGKPLSHLELLKNRLIYLSTKFSVDNFEKEQLRKRINECWKTVYHNLGKNKDNPLEDDKFLINHFFIYFGKGMIEEEERGIRHMRSLRRMFRLEYSDYLLENIFTTKNIENGNKYNLTVNFINEYVRDLKKSIEIWYKINNPEKSNFSSEEIKYLEKLNRLGLNENSSLILVFYSKVRDVQLRIKFLKLIEQTQFYQLLSSHRYYYSFREESRLISAIDLYHETINATQIIKDLEAKIRQYDSNKEYWKEVKQGFKNNGFYKWNGIRYFLYEYEMYLQSQSKSRKKKINWAELLHEQPDYKTIEHIYPQNPRKDCWTKIYNKYTPKERSALRHSLGNLLPLSKPRNSSFGNKCFKEKVSNSNNTVGYRYGSYSENKIAAYEKWTANDILERGIELLDFMESNWKISIGTRQEKIKFLNLEFMKEKKTAANTLYK
ncbi:DUF262 domain-containing HNH endonuclease family protein [Tenacibaculum sp. Mcav3-52]|uniref:DUF262 domain-containing protein n=1 Tax=Tenacibaculum sp. Mcav3-52 TaxID=2917762 RepID=UPI001EF23A75|nr:DUF262 domain-containing protein [Tenacibaculum sp. Mcav3-52]MCG7503219.1 DUF262 domain-containing HNH endonuclease family protein [Tenacibaculum sp. Mcav3-52]